MKKTILILAMAIAVSSPISCGGDGNGSESTKQIDSTAVADSAFAQIGKVRDLALIFQGGMHRIDWNEQQIAPYVTHKFANGNEDWLFDGFLFLEFKDGRGVQLSPGYDTINATKDIWEWYLDRLFEKNKSLDALNTVIRQKKALIGDPGFKHKVALTAVVPFSGQTDWGELDGVKLDFNNTEDQKTAMRWFINQLTERFAAAGYENLELYGIYWIDEDMVHTNDFPREIKDYIHGKGLEFIWIPYYNAPGTKRWKSLGFDIAYQQPNHFFSRDVPDSRLDEAIDLALAYNMGVQFETDEKALSQDPDSYRDRMLKYLDVFERRGVFEKAPVSYYTGYHLFTDMVEHPSPENQAIMDRLARHIVNRRKIKLGK